LYTRPSAILRDLPDEVTAGVLDNPSTIVYLGQNGQNEAWKSRGYTTTTLSLSIVTHLFTLVALHDKPLASAALKFCRFYRTLGNLGIKGPRHQNEFATLQGGEFGLAWEVGWACDLGAAGGTWEQVSKDSSPFPITCRQSFESVQKSFS
jgi:hypothetical protein